MLETIFTIDIKFCREENVDQHIWKILYYNIIELLKKYHSKAVSDEEVHYKTKCLQLIDDGVVYFENLLKTLEQFYKFSLDDYLDNNAGGKLRGYALTMRNLLFSSIFQLQPPSKG